MGAPDNLLIGVADAVVARLADELPDDQSCVFAAIAVVARVAMGIHAGDVQRAQGLINGICETAKLEALNLSIGGQPS